MEFYVSEEVKDAAETVAAGLEDAFIFYSPDDAGAVVMQYNATEDGQTFVVDIDENGNIRSALVELATGMDA